MKPEQDNNSRLDEAQVQKAKISTLAIFAFTLSIVCIAAVFIPTVVPCFIVPFLAIPSIFMGCFSLIAIKQSKGKLRGNWMAGIGITISFAWMIFLFVFVPMLREIKQYAYEMKQRAQLMSIDIALELFNSEFEGYPPSDALGEGGKPYCGAMKLCEALMGRDLEGFHPSSRFRREETDDSGIPLYNSNTLDIRKGPYLSLESANAFPLKDLYENIGSFDGNDFVLCDVFRNVPNRKTGKKASMPILYYRTDTSKTAHNINDPDDPHNIYDYKDNHVLLALGVPGNQAKKHPLFRDPKRFYEMTKDYGPDKAIRPQRADTFILLSAGYDGLYGTKDDIVNFDF